MSFKYVDLFAGIGGFAAALNTAGGQPALAVEFDAKAATTYFLNFGHSPYGDVRDVAGDAHLVPDHQVLTGGFPCQPFSKSGAQLGTSEDRGNLFDEILKIVSVKKPLVLLLENVRNLAGPRHLDEWTRIVNSLREVGYRVSGEPALFSPHLLGKNYGGRPQHRVRLFITATYNPDPDGSNHENPLPVVGISGKNGIKWDLAADLPLDSDVPQGTLTSAENMWLNAWQEWIENYRNTLSHNLPGFPIWTDYWFHARPEDFSDMPKWKQSIVDKNIQLFRASEGFSSKWLKDWRVRDDFPPSRRKFEWQAGLSESVWDCLVQLRPSGIRVKRPDYVPTLVALSQTPIYGPFKRRLTERELARLQGFPEGYDFGVQDEKVTAKQLGNAVNIGVIAYVLRKHCERDFDILSGIPEGQAFLNDVFSGGHNPDVVFDTWGGRVVPPN